MKQAHKGSGCALRVAASSRLLATGFGLALLLITGTAAVAQPAPVRVTLDAAIARGLDGSHRLAELTAREAAAGAEAAGREIAERPQIALVGGYTRTSHVTEFGVPQPNGQLRVIFPDVPDNYRTRLDLQWPIYTAGRTDAIVSAARAEVAAIGKDLAAARADLRLEITRAFWALATANHTLRVVEEAVKLADAHLEDVRNRLDVGLILPSDVLAVETQRARQQVLLIQARNTRELAAADFGRLVGLDPDVPVDVDARLEKEPVVSDPIQTLVAEARRSRPERQALETREQVAVARGLAARAATRPLVAVTGGIDYARPNPRILPRVDEWKESWDVSVNISWPLWDGGRSRADLAEATFNQRAARERVAEFDRTLEAEVRQRRLDLESSRAEIDAATEGVRSATEARRVIEERFRAGVATSTDVLDAQVALLQTELDRARALAGERLAAARLERALGR